MNNLTQLKASQYHFKIHNKELIHEQFNNEAKTFYLCELCEYFRYYRLHNPISWISQVFFFSLRITRKQYLVRQNIKNSSLFQNDCLFIESSWIHCQRLGCLNFRCIYDLYSGNFVFKKGSSGWWKTVVQNSLHLNKSIAWYNWNLNFVMDFQQPISFQLGRIRKKWEKDFSSDLGNLWLKYMSKAKTHPVQHATYLCLHKNATPPYGLFNFEMRWNSFLIKRKFSIS